MRNTHLIFYSCKNVRKRWGDLANYSIFCDFLTGVRPTTNCFVIFFIGVWPTIKLFCDFLIENMQQQKMSNPAKKMTGQKKFLGVQLTTKYI